MFSKLSRNDLMSISSHPKPKLNNRNALHFKWIHKRRKNVKAKRTQTVWGLLSPLVSRYTTRAVHRAPLHRARTDVVCYATSRRCVREAAEMDCWSWLRQPKAAQIPKREITSHSFYSIQPLIHFLKPHVAAWSLARKDIQVLAYVQEPTREWQSHFISKWCFSRVLSLDTEVRLSKGLWGQPLPSGLASGKFSHRTGGRGWQALMLPPFASQKCTLTAAAIS